MDPEALCKKAGQWITVAIEGHHAWPTVPAIYRFRTYDLLLRPGDNATYSTVSLKYDDYRIDAKEAQKLIMNFISSLAWYEDSPIYLRQWIGGSRCFNIGKPGLALQSKPSTSTLPTFSIKALAVRELPDSLDPNVRATLAFYREGLELDNAAYSFLSFYKIINLFVGPNGAGRKQVKWINDNITLLKDKSDAKKRVDELRKTSNDIGGYLYASCRCAVAHADTGQTFIDPEDVDELMRLNADLPLIRALSQIVIEKEHGVKSRQTIFREHLYELRGFKPILGAKLVEEIAKDEEL